MCSFVPALHCLLSMFSNGWQLTSFFGTWGRRFLSFSDHSFPQCYDPARGFCAHYSPGLFRQLASLWSSADILGANSEKRRSETVPGGVDFGPFRGRELAGGHGVRGRCCCQDSEIGNRSTQPELIAAGSARQLDFSPTGVADFKCKSPARVNSGRPSHPMLRKLTPEDALSEKLLALGGILAKMGGLIERAVAQR